MRVSREYPEREARPATVSAEARRSECSCGRGGEPALVAGGRRTATIVALAPAETRSIHQTDLNAPRRWHRIEPAVQRGGLVARGGCVIELRGKAYERRHAPTYGRRSAWRIG